MMIWVTVLYTTGAKRWIGGEITFLPIISQLLCMFSMMMDDDDDVIYQICICTLRIESHDKCPQGSCTEEKLFGVTESQCSHLAWPDEGGLGYVCTVVCRYGKEDSEEGTYLFRGRVGRASVG